uniref:Uncharacterized protein n=1 Tax=Pygocentrus nattereri TaxID=42514 RepID=A0AAR2KID1_PYGNA
MEFLKSFFFSLGKLHCSMLRVPGPKAPFFFVQYRGSQVTGHRPIVLHFKTDKHLLIRADQRPVFLTEGKAKGVFLKLLS